MDRSVIIAFAFVTPNSYESSEVSHKIFPKTERKTKVDFEKTTFVIAILLNEQHCRISFELRKKELVYEPFDKSCRVHLKKWDKRIQF